MNEPMFRFAVREDLKDVAERFLPRRAESGSVGYDVRCAQEDRKPIILRPGQCALIDLGIRVIAPEGWWLDLRPRSSTFAKKRLHYLIGTIDTSFRGIMRYSAQYLPDINALGKDLAIEFGEAIGQLIPVRVETMVVKEVSNEEFDEHCRNEVNVRGTKGWGSTG